MFRSRITSLSGAFSGAIRSKASDLCFKQDRAVAAFVNNHCSAGRERITQAGTDA